MRRPKQNPHGPAVPVGVVVKLVIYADMRSPLWAYGAPVGGGCSKGGVRSAMWLSWGREVVDLSSCARRQLLKVQWAEPSLGKLFLGLASSCECSPQAQT